MYALGGLERQTLNGCYINNLKPRRDEEVCRSELFRWIRFWFDTYVSSKDDTI